jgi:hypothetical protein
MDRRISTAEKPKRLSLTHHTSELSKTAKATPTRMKNSQNPQQKTEKPTVLLKS